MTAIFLQGNSRDVLKGLPPDFIHCVTTSPPYFGLRKYDGGEEVWGGDEDCLHEWGSEIIRRDRGSARGDSAVVGNQLREVSGTDTRQGNFCIKCGAWKGQLGAEPTTELYIQHLIEIMREVRRVLRPDGVFWLNIGDSWAGSGKGQMGNGEHASKHGEKQHTNTGAIQGGLPKGYADGDTKPLDMVLIPEQLALAARADGWYVRSVLIWAKGVSLSDEYNGNPMPECLDPSTRVFVKTHDGWMHRVSLDELSRMNPVPQILSPTGWVDVKSIWRTDKPAMTLEAGKVERVICSPDHRFPVSHDRRRLSTEMKEASNIRFVGYNDYLLYKTIQEFCPTRMRTYGRYDLGYDVGYLVGIYVAEGSTDTRFGSGVQISLGDHESELHDKVSGILGRYGLDIHDDGHDGRKNVFRVYDDSFCRLIDVFVTGQAKTKRLSVDLVLNSPEQFRQGMLDGYIAGDGSDRPAGGWCAASASRRLRDDISTLASSLGIITSKGQQRSVSDIAPKLSTGHTLWTPYVNRTEKRGTDGIFCVPVRRRVLTRQNGETKPMIDVEVDGGLFLIGDGLVSHNSVNGWRWERHKIKVGDNGRGKESWRQGANSTPQQDHAPDGSFQLSAVWQDCPGCPKCSPHDGYVLRKGSWRPTDAYEHILMLTKTNSYYCDREAVLEPITESTIKRVALADSRVNYDSSSEGYKRGQGAVADRGGVDGLVARPSGSGRNLRSVLMIPTTGYKGAHFACVDEDTECLTTRGWLHYADLCDGELVASYNIQSGRLRWSPLLSVSKYDVDGAEMVYSNHRSLDMALTLDHRCLVRWGTGVRIKLAGKLSPYDQVITSAEWEDMGGLTPVSPAMATLIGWYLTEGHEPKHRGYSVEISQSLTANPRKVDDIRSALTDVEAEFEEATFEREYRGKLVSQTNFRIHGFVAAKLRELCPRKQFPIGVLLWDTTLLRRMFNAIIAGDGNIRSDNRKFFTQKDKGRLDVFQAIAVRLGYGAGIFRRVDGRSAVSVYDNKTSRALRDSSGRSLLSNVFYTGVVWCPQTPDTTFVARRNGKVFITGNTFPPRLIEPLLKAATSEKGCCPECGSPYARVVDKGFTAHDGDTSSQYDTGTNANRLALLRQAARKRGGEYGSLSYNSKYKDGGVTGLATQGFQRNETIESERERSREEAKILYPDDERAQQDYINHIHDHGGLDKGRTIGWLPTCGCNAGDPIPCRVLDPFSGAGTTALVSERLNLDSINIDTSQQYIDLAQSRIKEDEDKRAEQEVKRLMREAKKQSSVKPS